MTDPDSAAAGGSKSATTRGDRSLITPRRDGAASGAPAIGERTPPEKPAAGSARPGEGRLEAPRLVVPAQTGPHSAGETLTPGNRRRPAVRQSQWSLTDDGGACRPSTAHARPADE